MSEQFDSAPETGEDVTTTEELEDTLEPTEGGEATPDENDEVAESVDAVADEVADEIVTRTRSPRRSPRTRPPRRPRSSTRSRPSAASS